MTRALVACAVLAVTATAASAQPSSKASSDATAAYQEGQRRYLDEDYVGAAEQFEAAYRLDPDPAYLFNIAQAYRLAKSCERALAYYKQFLAQVPNAPNADTVNKYIGELEADCPPPPGRSAPSFDPETEPARPASPSHLRRNLGIGALGVGAVGVTLGVVYMFKVRGDEDDRAALCPMSMCDWTEQDSQQEAALKSRGDRHSAIMATSYIVGGAAIAGGVALLLTSRSAEQPTVAITPTPGGAFVSWSVRR